MKSNSSGLLAALEIIDALIKRSIANEDEWGRERLTEARNAITCIGQEHAQAWHVRIVGCDGSADWVELGRERPLGVNGADLLPMVYAADSATAKGV